VDLFCIFFFKNNLVMVNQHFQSQALIFFPMQEFLVKNADRVELMAMLGLFGAIFSAIQMYP